MADTDDMALAMIRKHIAERRVVLMAKFPKNLPMDEYHRHCGRYEEFEALATVVQDAVRKANDAESGADDDPEID